MSKNIYERAKVVFAWAIYKEKGSRPRLPFTTNDQKLKSKLPILMFSNA
jgi:hypothetical protein